MSLQNKIYTESKSALDSMKTEIANELGLTNYDKMDKGNLTARQNGYVGGYMTKKLVDTIGENAKNKIFVVKASCALRTTAAEALWQRFLRSFIFFTK